AGIGRVLARCRGVNPRALIVEDHFATRTALCDYFESAGYTVDSAGSLREAVELLDVHHYAIAFTDLRLDRAGHADGLEVVSAARRRFPAGPVVLLTSVASPQVQAEASRRGAEAILVK